jgi:unsaturated rhamnogalacturonyl hydrolase
MSDTGTRGAEPDVRSETVASVDRLGFTVPWKVEDENGRSGVAQANHSIMPPMLLRPPRVLDSPRVACRVLLPCMFACLLPAVAVAAEGWTIGLSTTGAPIEAIVVAGRSANSPTVLLVGGLERTDQSSDAVAREAVTFEQIPQPQRAFRLVAIARANPDAQPLQFPPSGVAYREHIESHVLWRWIGTHAPDLVLAAGADPGLVDALSQNVVIDVGGIPARRVDTARLLQSVTTSIPFSSAHQELERRLARSPRALAEELARIYGNEFTQPNYIAAMALVSRLRLGERDEVGRVLAPYLDGAQDSFARPSQSSLASHLLFFEYARRARDDRARALVLRAAASGFTENGDLREFMPLHGGWSDSLFMDVPILAMAGALTGERRYFDMAARHVAFMQKIVLRPDGLYRHQASTDAAWGRGNAFPALGLALTLSEFPKDHSDYPRLLASYRAHMVALARVQDENGMWRNVIDRPGAYPEYSATAMIATAMLRGIRNGWIDRETFEPLIDKAWKAILARTGADGRLVDVCESTGTRGLTAEDYLRRTAILGRDDRGGGMAMFFATELAGL